MNSKRSERRGRENVDMVSWYALRSLQCHDLLVRKGLLDRLFDSLGEHKSSIRADCELLEVLKQ